MIENIPWTEKYRPSNFDEIVYQSNIKKLLMNSYKNKNLPHLLFHGPPGTGKTSSIITICKLFYGIDYRKYVLELNASDDRGITVIRGKIKDFSRLSLKNDDGPPFKIIILDEADFLTADAQAALRRCIECYSNITRYCIICNYINKIISPIQSRCAILYFKPIPISNIQEKLELIIEKEKMKITENTFKQILSNSNGDLRKAINSLQLYNVIKDEDTLEKLDTSEFSNTKLFTDFLANLKKYNLKTIAKNIQTQLSYGYSGKFIISIIINYYLNSKKITNLKKYCIMNMVSDIECRLINGSNEYLQIFSLIKNINNCINEMI